MDKKPFWQSKTIWVNFLTLAGSIYIAITGKQVDMSPEAMISIIAGINIFLRIVTKDRVSIS